MHLSDLARTRQSRPVRALALVAAVVAVAVAAIGTTGASAKSSAKAAGAANVTAAKNAVTPFLTEPTSITGLTALPKAPKKGLTIGIVTCPEAECSLFFSYTKAAAQALGWNLKTVVPTISDPGAGFQQMIDANVSAIIDVAFDVDQFKPEFQQMVQKKIPLFEVAGSDPADGPKNDIYSDIGGAQAQYQWGQFETNWAIAASKGKANILDINAPIYPVLEAQARGEQSALKANCPSTCSYHALDITVNEAATNAIPGLITSYLQANPKINYIHFVTQQYETGVAAALKTAGLSSKVKLYGSAAQVAQFKEIATGVSSAWQIYPQPEGFWATVDQIARYETKSWSASEATAAAKLPTFFLTSKARASQLSKSTAPYPWPGVKNFEGLYKKAWKG
jgi:ABC-type sugar transport system substrate-binding protein